MIGKTFIQWTVYGTIAGALLAAFFYFLDGIFNVHLYLFLLNIDFLDLPEHLIYNPYFQLFLHFIISVFLLALIDSIALKLKNSPFHVSFLLNALMSFSFFPLYLMAETKPFYPPLFFPFLIWFAGHMVYAAIVGYFITHLTKKEGH